MFTWTKHSLSIWKLGRMREQAEEARPLDCLFGEFPPLDCLFEGALLLDCLFDGNLLLDCLFASYYCSSPFVLLTPRQKQLLASPTLSFLASSPCFLSCFLSCCRLQSRTLFSVMNSLCFLDAGSPYSSRAHPCYLKIQMLEMGAHLQEQLDSQVPSCAASKYPSAIADLP